VSKELRVLSELGAELDRAAQQGLEGTARRAYPRLGVLRSVASGFGLAAAVGVVVVVVGAILLVGHGPRHATPGAADRAAAQKASNDAPPAVAHTHQGERAQGGPSKGRADSSGAAGVAQSFAAFRRERAAADHLPASISIKGIAAQYGADANQSRLVLDTNEERIWLVPGDTMLCAVIVKSDGATDNGYCVQDDVAESRGLVTGNTAQGSSASGQMWSGVLPDGARSLTAMDKSGPIQVNVSSDGGFSQPVSDPTALSYTTPDGVPVSIPAAAGLSSTAQRICPSQPTVPLCRQP
jgi:hypothetical protein